MPPLPMTPYEKSQRARKITLYAGAAALVGFAVYGAISADFEKAPVSNAGKVAVAKSFETKDAVDRPSRDDAIIVGSIPPKIDQGTVDEKTGLHVKRVQLPSPEAIRASLSVDRKIAIRPKAREFETCLPNCETRDPLIIGATTSHRPDRQSPSENEAEAVLRPEPQWDRSLLQRGGDFLGLVADAPATTIDKSKQAIAYAAQLLQ